MADVYGEDVLESWRLCRSALWQAQKLAAEQIENQKLRPVQVNQDEPTEDEGQLQPTEQHSVMGEDEGQPQPTEQHSVMAEDEGHKAQEEESSVKEAAVKQTALREAAAARQAQNNCTLADEVAKRCATSNDEVLKLFSERELHVFGSPDGDAVAMAACLEEVNEQLIGAKRGGDKQQKKALKRKSYLMDKMHAHTATRTRIESNKGNSWFGHRN